MKKSLSVFVYVLLAVNLFGEVIYKKSVDGVDSGNNSKTIILDNTNVLKPNISAWSDMEITNAASNNAFVSLSPGQYRVGYSTGGAITIDGKTNVTIDGNGSGTILKSGLAGDGSGQPCYMIMFIKNSSNITIKNITFSGLLLANSQVNSGQGWHMAIKLQNCSNITIENCNFEGFYTGAIDINTNCRNCRINSCRFDNIANVPTSGAHYGAVNLTGDGVENIQLINNTFTKMKHSGISVYGKPQKLLISQNIIEFDSGSSMGMGIYAPQGLRKTIISSNIITDSPNEAIIISGGIEKVSNNIIKGNVLKGSYSGITLNEISSSQQAENNIITGNNIDGSGTADHGIFVNKAISTTITNNCIRNCDINGISLENSTRHTLISGNSLINCDKGAYVSGESIVCANSVVNATIGIHYDYTSIVNTISIVHNIMQNVTTTLLKGSNAYSWDMNIDDNR